MLVLSRSVCAGFSQLPADLFADTTGCSRNQNSRLLSSTHANHHPYASNMVEGERSVPEDGFAAPPTF